MKDKNKNIGDIYRDAFKDYRLEPSEKAWANIEAKLTKPASPAKSLLKNNYFIAAATVVIIAVIALVVFRNNDIEKNLNSPEQHEKMSVIADKDDNKTNTDKRLTPANEYKESKTNVKKADQEISENSENEINSKLEPQKAEAVVNEKKAEKSELISDIQERKTRKTEQISPKTEIIIEEVNQNDLIQHEKQIQKQELTTQKENPEQEIVLEENTLEDMPVTPIEFPSDKKICRGEEVELEIEGGIAYEWSNGEIRRVVKVSPVVTTVYAITVTDAGQNTHYGNVMVEVYECKPLFVPDAFTPDGDGLNDVFLAKGTDVVDFSMRIHSRSGNLIFQSNDINQGWDGRINGSIAQPGVYFYIISFVDSMQKKHSLNGHVTLLR